MLEVDRSVALANMSLDVGIREAGGTGPCDERLARYIFAERELRRTRFGRGPFLIAQVR
jgi:hypothetical protein